MLQTDSEIHVLKTYIQKVTISQHRQQGMDVALTREVESSSYKSFRGQNSFGIPK